jgi:regulator of RNase E activity RraA
VPVSVGGITVYQGDLLHGDLNGVTTIPHEIASEVPDACKELMAAEDIVLHYVRGKDVTIKGMEAARVECGNVIEKLGKRLRGEK